MKIIKIERDQKPEVFEQGKVYTFGNDVLMSTNKGLANLYTGEITWNILPGNPITSARKVKYVELKIVQ